MQVRIVTDLRREAALDSLRELINRDRWRLDLGNNVRGAVNHDRVAIAVGGWPLFSVACFHGRVIGARFGSVIEGNIEAGTSARLFATVLVISFLGGVLGLDNFDPDIRTLPGFGIAVLLFALGWLYVRGTKNLLQRELLRAVRGKLAVATVKKTGDSGTRVG